MSDFTQSLINIRSEYEQKAEQFAEAWLATRRLILKLFTEAVQALNGAKIEHENGTSSTLSWRNASISFKADEKRRRIVRSRPGEQDEPYEPSALTQDKIESEVRSFVRAVLEG